MRAERKNDDPDMDLSLVFGNKLRHPILDKETEYALIAKAKGGDREAMNSLMESNLRLMVTVANRYRRYANHCGLEIRDLISSCMEGLRKAVEHFQLYRRRKVRLSTYAVPKMRHEVGRYLDNCGAMIRVPVHLHHKRPKVEREIFFLLGKLGREPTELEIAASLTKRQLAEFRKQVGRKPTRKQRARRTVTAAVVRSCLRMPTLQPVPFDMRVETDDDGANRLDAHSIVTDDAAADRFDEVDRHLMMRGGVGKAFAALSQLEREVLHCRYRHDLSLKETGVRIRHLTGGKPLSGKPLEQIELQAIDKLRAQLCAPSA